MLGLRPPLLALVGLLSLGCGRPRAPTHQPVSSLSPLSGVHEVQGQQLPGMHRVGARLHLVPEAELHRAGGS
ncbi:ITGB2 isoform 8 [Pan troglodytes]|uniref:ITGB2 isoform 8 n=1 Tax=Pan troglodytes TaxID=9598 RepID=A0A2J8M8N3_PANTR|nr:ITGB2 isoform 8 [Pan troglodytes]